MTNKSSGRTYGCLFPQDALRRRPAVTLAVHDTGLCWCWSPHPTPPLPSLSCLVLQLMASQGVETIEEFCNNASRPKVSVQEWNAAMQPHNFEPATVNVLFAKCLSKVCGCGCGCQRGARFATRVSVFFLSDTMVTAGPLRSPRVVCPLCHSPTFQQQASKT